MRHPRQARAFFLGVTSSRYTEVMKVNRGQMIVYALPSWSTCIGDTAEMVMFRLLPGGGGAAGATVVAVSAMDCAVRCCCCFGSRCPADLNTQPLLGRRSKRAGHDLWEGGVLLAVASR